MEDREILENFYSSHSNEWLGILLQRYTLLLLGTCMKYLKNEEDARDSVQQIFEKTIQELHRYRVEYFKSWIYMVAKNHCLMKLRDKGKHSVELDERVQHPADDQEDIRVHYEKEKNLVNMAAALHQLNKEQQQCVTLFYLEKKSYQEITDHTGYTLLQVKSHIQNGKRNLKIIMEKMNTHSGEK